MPDGSFDGSGHHMLGMIRAMRERSNDFPLAELDFTRCQSIVDFWRSRPENRNTDMPLSKKTCGNYLGELKRFFDWLHKSPDWDWRKPPDYDDISHRPIELESDLEIESREIPTYTVDQLRTPPPRKVLVRRVCSDQHAIACHERGDRQPLNVDVLLAIDLLLTGFSRRLLHARPQRHSSALAKSAWQALVRNREPDMCVGTEQPTAALF